MADRIVVLNQGRVEQLGTPLELYRRPRNLFVAGFIGSPKMNFLKVRVTAADDSGVTVALPGDKTLKVPVSADGVEPGNELTLGVRPEHLGVRDGVDGPADVRLSAEVLVVEHLGGEILVHSQLTDKTELELKSVGHDEVARGDRLDVAVRASLCHLFDADGDALAPIKSPRLEAAI